MSTSKATYFPNEIKHKGHYYTLIASLFVGNFHAAKQETKKLKKEHSHDNSLRVRRFGENVNTYKCYSVN